MNDDVVIRRLSMGEGQVYRKVRLDALKDSPEAFATSYGSALNRTEESWGAQADASAEGCDRATFVVMSDGPVGLAAVYRDPMDFSTGELIQMWIAPSHRGSGVANRLLDHLFEWAACNAFTSIRAEVTRSNPRALGFYQRYGFRTTGVVDGHTLLITEVEPAQNGT